jgi:hypothetical protein
MLANLGKFTYIDPKVDAITEWTSSRDVLLDGIGIDVFLLSKNIDRKIGE